jgi:hypothetical protein
MPSTGAYVLVAPVGAVTLNAEVPSSSLVGTGETTVPALPETATLAIPLSGAVTTATVSIDAWDGQAMMRLFRERLLARLVEWHALSAELVEWP